MKYLYISCNKLNSLAGIENLTNLTALYLYDNKLTNLKGIAKLTNLKYLDVGSNNLTNLKGIENLTKLTELGVGSNNLTNLKGIENLTKLTELAVEYNKIKSLPDLTKLTKLESEETSFEGNYLPASQFYNKLPKHLLSNLYWLQQQVITQYNIPKPNTISMRVNCDRAAWTEIEYPYTVTKKIDNAGTKPVIVNGKTLIPLRFTGENLGVTVKWDQKTKNITMTKGSTKLVLTIGSNTMTKTVTKNGKATKTNISIKTAPQLIGGKTMVPLRDVCSVFGFYVRYDAPTKIIVISNIMLNDALYNEYLKEAKRELK